MSILHNSPGHLEVDSRKEVWFELGDHSGEDVFLYVPEVSDDTFWSPDDIQFNRPSFVKRYENREFGFEVEPSFPGDNGGSELLLVFLAADTMEGYLSKRRPVSKLAQRTRNRRRVDHIGDAMLVDIPEVVQGTKYIWVAPSVVRLYGIYPITDRLGEFAYLRDILLEKRGLTLMEFQSKAVVRLEDLPNTPDQIVERRSKIVDNIASGESDRRRRLAINMQRIREKGILPFTLHASEHFTWFGRKEGIDQYFEAVNAHVCPVKPQLSKMHVVIPRIDGPHGPTIRQSKPASQSRPDSNEP